MKKPSSGPKAQVAPSVPSFGAPLLPQKPPAPLPSEGGLKQRPSTTLGLIPQSQPSLQDSEPEDASDEEEEEIDEEAALSSLQNGPLSFEFNGELSTLGSKSDIAEWIAERRKRWPSKRRVEEKQQEVQGRMQERRRIEQETREAIAVASGGEYHTVERRDDRQQRVMRKPAAERSVRENGDATMEDTRAGTEPTQETTADSTPLTSQPTTNPLDDATLPTHDHHASDSDSDAPPEITSSKPSQPLRIPPPSSKPTPALPSTQKPCTSFLNQGRCKFGNKCRYKHDSTFANGVHEKTSKRKTLFQRVSGSFSFVMIVEGGRGKGERERWRLRRNGLRLRNKC
jgi:hypothetical protein